MNQFYPMYQPIYPNPYYGQGMNTPQVQAPVQQAEPTIQKSNELIPISSREVAKNYPVAPRNSVSFKDENAPYIYIKTMGLSQFDPPKFEVFKLVKENEDENNEQSESTPENTEPQIPMVEASVINDINESISVLDEEMKSTRIDIDYLKDRIEDLGKRKMRNPKKVGEPDADE